MIPCGPRLGMDNTSADSKESGSSIPLDETAAPRDLGVGVISDLIWIHVNSVIFTYIVLHTQRDTDVVHSESKK
jgi:hypothetical protein